MPGNEHQQIREEREGVYGAWRPNMRATTLHIEAMRQQWEANDGNADLPPYFAPLVMVAVKLNRIASGHYHADNFADLRNYLDMVEQMQREGGR